MRPKSASSSSFDMSRFPKRPTSGSWTDSVIAIFWREVRDRAAHVHLLEQTERDLPRREAERRRDPGGLPTTTTSPAPGATISASRSAASTPCTIAFRMSPITQLADDVDPRPRGLEERVDLRQVHAALGGAEHEPDGAHRALRRAAP